MSNKQEVALTAIMTIVMIDVVLCQRLSSRAILPATSPSFFLLKMWRPKMVGPLDTTPNTTPESSIPHPKCDLQPFVLLWRV